MKKWLSFAGGVFFALVSVSAQAAQVNEEQKERQMDTIEKMAYKDGARYDSIAYTEFDKEDIEEIYSIIKEIDDKS